MGLMFNTVHIKAVKITQNFHTVLTQCFMSFFIDSCLDVFNLLLHEEEGTKSGLLYDVPCSI